MIHDNLDFHNTVDLPPATGGGLHIARFPSSIWNKAEAPNGCANIRSSNGCEIRFVTNKKRIRIYLRSLVNGNKPLVHLLGNHILKTEMLPGGGLHCLDIEIPEAKPNIHSKAWCDGGFSPNVYRIVSVGDTLAYHGVDTLGGDVRPPEKSEVPNIRWLAYGSSITQCGGSFHSYVNAAAQTLGIDAMNLGMGGSCRIETAVADFIASRDDWDVASFELGVNMRRPPRDNQLFAEKVDYLLKTVTTAHPEKPVFLITHFRNAEHHETEVSDIGRDQMEKDEILRRVAAEYPGQVTLIEGTDVARDLRGFKTDLLHPEPFASVRMGIHLAEKMEARLESL